MRKQLSIVLGLWLSIGVAAKGQAAAPEDVFKRKIIITKNRLPLKFASERAFIQALRTGGITQVWPAEEKGNDHAIWHLEYMAFFAQPLNDLEVTVKFYDVTGGAQRYIAGDQQYTRARDTRIFGSSIKLAKPEFEANHRYLMTINTGSRTVATTTFWLRGKGPNYSGKVEFSEEEASKK
jgi:hypothetical protein